MDDPPEKLAADSPRPTTLLRGVVAEGTFIAALLFYLGAMYMSTFYAYFHISLTSLDLGFSELVTQSLRLLKLEALVAAGLIVLVVSAPWARTPAQMYGGVGRRAAAKAEAVAARLSVPVAVIGVVLLALWNEIRPYSWTALSSSPSGCSWASAVTPRAGGRRDCGARLSRSSRPEPFSSGRSPRSPFRPPNGTPDPTPAMSPIGPV
ncbi:hypothetical protein [Streptomyces sp. NPDC023588]|uniref:hypothetical protein n=1 Tax=Streptomyces sp. NPDC023588 TaxID=3154907 RepID=UPI0033D2A498